MKYLNIFIFFLFISASLLKAQTDVGGYITTATWSKDNSPYIVNDDIEAENLTIEPGVTVLFDGSFKFEITESLEAIGFHSDSIIFKPADDNTSGWAGVHLKSGSSTSQLAYCRISGANDQALNIDNCDSPEINNCRFTNNEDDGIKIVNTSVELNNCIVSNNPGKGINLSNAQFSASNSIFSKNNEGFYSLVDQDVINLTNCVIADNSSKSIITFGTAQITNSILFGNDLEITNSDTSRIKVTYSIVEGGLLYPGVGNINSTPEFLEGTEYLLGENAPGVDRGNPESSFNDAFFPPGLGSERNDMGAYGGSSNGNWLAPLIIAPTSIDFGKVTRDSSKTIFVTLKNFRKKSLNISEIQFNNNDAYFTSNIQDTTVLSADSILIDLTFTPGKNGVLTSTLSITTADEGVYNATLLGEGTVSRISLQNTDLEFETTVVGTSSDTTLGLLNLGTDTLRINGILSDNIVFHSGINSLKIAPNSPLVKVPIYFTPDSAIAYSDSIIILSNDPNEPRVAIPVSGTGQKGPLLTADNNLSFDKIPVLTDSTLSIQLLNSGDLDLNIDGLSISATDTTAGAFSILNTPQEFPHILKPDSSFDLNVSFSPEETGFDAAYLTVESNDALQEETKILLQGFATAPAFAASVQTLNFDSVDVNFSSSKTLVISNLGDANLKLNNIQINNSIVTDTLFKLAEQDLSFPIILEPDANYNIDILFQPNKSGTDSAHLAIETNEPFENNRIVKLLGHGIAPRIALSQQSLDFGTIPYDDENVLDFTIFNYGEQDLILAIDSLIIVGNDTTSFKIDKLLSKDINIVPGDSNTIPIRFKPVNTGIKQATLNINSNDPFAPNQQVSLFGIASDNQAASIQLSTGSATLTNGSTGNMNFEISSNASIDSAFLYLRSGGSTNYDKLQLSGPANGNEWSTNVDTSMINACGLEYYLKAYHGFINTTYPESGNENPQFMPVVTPSLTFPNITKKEIYQMISIPAATEDSLLNTIFSDDLGEPDIKSYRIFDCTDGATYTEITDLNSKLVPGKALWLITKDQMALDVPQATSISTIENFVLQLREGWNMIGNPFAFDISWMQNDPHHILKYHDGSDWVDKDTFSPFEGYAVYARQDTTINLLPKNTAVSSAKMNKINSTDWTIRLLAHSDKHKDTYNFAGVRENAKYNQPEPPAIGDNIRLHFTEVVHKDKNINKYDTDFRNAAYDGYIFEFEIAATTSGKKSIEVQTQGLPVDYDWRIYSDQTKVSYEQQEIEISGKQQTFKLIVGPADFITQTLADFKELPTTFKLDQNYPNPFNPETNLRFQLPKSADITVKVYNVLGQKVKTLINKKTFEAGYYELKWDGSDETGNRAATGTYFLHLSSSHFNKTIKMILQK